MKDDEKYRFSISLCYESGGGEDWYFEMKPPNEFERLLRVLHYVGLRLTDLHLEGRYVKVCLKDELLVGIGNLMKDRYIVIKSDEFMELTEEQMREFLQGKVQEGD